MASMTSGPVSLAAVLLCARAFAAGHDPAPAEVGLRIGDQAPAFTLKDQNNNDVSLDSLVKKGPVAVVFYRSADWCLFCKFQLKQLQGRVKEFAEAGGQVVGVSYDSTRVLKRFAESQQITLPMLSDEGSRTIDAYHVRDPARGPREGFASHVTFVIDSQRVVRAMFKDVIYQEQPGIGFLLKAIKEARSPSPKSS
jgi:peroxiredoxin